MLRVENLTVSYTDAPVLDQVNLSVENGETLGLIGLNGAGKTTLIKAILGLRSPSSGHIYYHDDKIEDVQKAFRKDLAFLPERFEPPWFLTGLEFVKFSASLYRTKLNRGEIDRVAESLELSPEVLPRMVQTYSKGMRQKLGLIATILTGCNFLILDEPMSGLDPQARVCVKNNLLKLREEGRTIFLSSHILSDMEEICDRVAVLHAAKMQFTGPPGEMIKSHKTKTLEQAFLKIIDIEAKAKAKAKAKSQEKDAA